MEPKRLLINLN